MLKALDMTKIFVFFTLLLSIAVGGCTDFRSQKQQLIQDGQYWQRAETSSAIYVRGPKAQQMLSRDIANCTVEIRELERLNVLRDVTPADRAVMGDTNDPDTPAGEIARFETPDRDAFLRTEGQPFTDFETCMQYAGWERVEFLPARLAEEARADYIESVYGQDRRIRYERGYVMYEDLEDPDRVEGDFSDVNE